MATVFVSRSCCKSWASGGFASFSRLLERKTRPAVMGPVECLGEGVGHCRCGEHERGNQPSYEEDTGAESQGGTGNNCEKSCIFSRIRVQRFQKSIDPERLQPLDRTTSKQSAVDRELLTRLPEYWGRLLGEFKAAFPRGIHEQQEQVKTSSGRPHGNTHESFPSSLCYKN